MQLKDYIPKLKNKYNNIFFSGIAFDSSKVKKNNIFFAIKGTEIDGNNFIDSAIKKGAKVIFTEKKKLRKKKRYPLFLFIKCKKTIIRSVLQDDKKKT